MSILLILAISELGTIDREGSPLHNTCKVYPSPGALAVLARPPCRVEGPGQDRFFVQDPGKWQGLSCRLFLILSRYFLIPPWSPSATPELRRRLDGVPLGSLGSKDHRR